VIFGLQPGLLLDLFPRTVAATLAAASRGSHRVPTEVVRRALVLSGRRRGPRSPGSCLEPPSAARAGRRRPPIDCQDSSRSRRSIAGILTAPRSSSSTCLPADVALAVGDGADRAGDHGRAA
jgi:hypothetical protein